MKPSISHRDKIFLATSIISFFFLLVMGMIERNYLAQRYIAQPILCAEDAQLCPDGSAVVRILPNCEFSPCPIISDTNTIPPASGGNNVTPIHTGGSGSVCTMEAKICPDGSAVSRSGPKCEFAPCPNPAPAPTSGTSGACTKESDCVVGYSCIDASPVIREGYENLRCWKNGAPRPICLSGETRIATPNGEVRVRDIVEGDMVWSQNSLGARVAVPVLISAHSIVPKDHQVVELQLADGRALRASLGHPLADGRTLGILKVGDRIDGTRVTFAKHVLYGEPYTYDILPLGDTGFYWADGILLGSTLKK